MTVPKVKGIPVQMGERLLVVPPLNFRSLQAFQERLKAFTGGTDGASLDTVLDVAEAALKRNYDDITRDFLLDSLDVSNMQEFMEAAMDVSGLKRKAHEQEVAAAQSDPSIGGSSTPT
jgi:hypothetical protein